MTMESIRYLTHSSAGSPRPPKEEDEYLRRKEREENWIRSFFNNDGIF